MSVHLDFRFKHRNKATFKTGINILVVSLCRQYSLVVLLHRVLSAPFLDIVLAILPFQRAKTGYLIQLLVIFTGLILFVYPVIQASTVSVDA
jgi:hypothetical protein